MPGLVPGIHVFAGFARKTWMTGTKPGHDHLRKKPLRCFRVVPAHAPGGGGRKWILYSADSATTSSGFCSFML